MKRNNKEINPRRSGSQHDIQDPACCVQNSQHNNPVAVNIMRLRFQNTELLMSGHSGPIIQHEADTSYKGISHGRSGSECCLCVISLCCMLTIAGSLAGRLSNLPRNIASNHKTTGLCPTLSMSRFLSLSSCLDL